MLIAEVDGVYWYRFVSEGCRIQRQLPFNLRRKTMLYEATLLPCLKLKSHKDCFPRIVKAEKRYLSRHRSVCVLPANLLLLVEVRSWKP